MTAWEALKALTAELSSATTAEDTGNALLSVARRFGLSNLLIIDARRLADGFGPSIVFSSSERNFIGFGSTVTLAASPAFLRAQTSDAPFFVSRPRALDGIGNVANSRERREGFVVPVYANDTLEWCVLFGGHDLDLPSPIRSMLSAAAHAALGRLAEHARSATIGFLLSAREYECLRWIADGKTDAEVGEILNISARTVRFHMRNVKDKLGVATRVQAVALRAQGSVGCGRRIRTAEPVA